MLISGSFFIVIILALTYAFINGMRDSIAIVATMISSRAFHSRAALGMTAIAEFLGSLLSERFGKVRWGVAGDILTAWVVTIPISGLFSAAIYSMLVFFNISF